MRAQMSGRQWHGSPVDDPNRAARLCRVARPYSIPGLTAPRRLKTDPPLRRRPVARVPSLRVRAGLLAAAALLAIVLPVAATAATTPVHEPAPALELALVAKINAVRARRGLRRLEPSPELNRAARAHGRQMLAGGYFDHRALWRRLVGLSTGGENLAWQAGTPSADRIVALWLASPPHRRNLLSPVWRRVGIGAVHGLASGGVYGYGPVTVIVADFGAP
jgi:uncharacterized protein YkwD